MHLVIGTIALSHPLTSSPTGPEVGASSLYPSKITVDPLLDSLYRAYLPTTGHLFLAPVTVVLISLSLAREEH